MPLSNKNLLMLYTPCPPQDFSSQNIKCSISFVFLLCGKTGKGEKLKKETPEQGIT